MKIDVITDKGGDANLNHIMMMLKQKYKQDFVLLDASKKVLISTADSKCCWCEEEQITQDMICDKCAELLKKGHLGTGVDRRYKKGDVLTINIKDIEVMTQEEYAERQKTKGIK